MRLPRTARRHGIAGVAAASALLVFAAPAAAETVTTLADSGAGSLRAAIDGAAPGETIDFQAGLQGTIELASTLAIDTTLRIDGPGARRLAVSGMDTSRVFRVHGAGTEAEIRDLTIRDGRVPGSHPMGAGVLADDGASRVRLVRVAVIDNEAASSTDLPLGGGIGVVAGTLELLESTVAGNRAPAGGGGGVMVGAPAAFLIRGSTIAGNSASAGGAVVSFDSSGQIVDSTIAGNTATTSGHGLLASAAGTITVGRSLLSGNGCGGPIVSSGDNVGSVCFAAPQASDTVDAAVQVGPLGDHGGPTDTVLPLPTSPAVDHVAGPCAAEDQRGVARPQGAACDAGAVEVRPARLTASAPLALGTVLVGDQGTAVSTTVTNAGDRDAVITAIDLTGSSEVQALPAGACAVSQTLAPGESCILSARLAPTSAGPKQATYTVSLAGSSVDVAVTGTGGAPPPPAGQNDGGGGGGTPPSDPPPPPPPASSAAAVVIGTGAKAAKTGKVKLRLRCQAVGLARCAGTLTLKIGARKLTRAYSIAAGKEGLVTLKLAAGDRRKLVKRRSLSSTVSVITAQGDGLRRTTHSAAFKLRS